MRKEAQAIARPNAGAVANFMKRVGHPEWRLVTDAKPKLFRVTERDAVLPWIDQQRGKPVYAMLPAGEDSHWWLQARLPRTAVPARLRPLPQMVICADEFVALWRLADPVSTRRGVELVQRIVGRSGRHAMGEPVPLPGSIYVKARGNGDVERGPVHVIPASTARGYRLVGNAFVDVDAQAAPRAVVDPRHLSIEIAEGVHIQPGTASNGFFVTVGGAGAGKTVALRKIAQDTRAYGVPVLIIDFHGDVEVKGTKRVLLASGPASKVGLNPLEVLTDPERRRTLHDQNKAFSALLGRAYPGIGHNQQRDLMDALRRVYASAGIHESDPDTWAREAPRIAGLIGELKLMAEEDPKGAGKRISGLLAMADGLFSNPLFSRSPVISTQDLLTGSLHLDLAALEDSEMLVVCETLLLRAFAALKALGPIPENPVDDSERFRLMVLIDEAQKLGGSDVLSMLFREARKFGLMLDVGTQSASNLAEDVRANAGCWLALKHSLAKEAELTGKSIGVKADELLDLKPKGDGYLRIGAHGVRRIQVKRP